MHFIWWRLFILSGQRNNLAMKWMEWSLGDMHEGDVECGCILNFPSFATRNTML
jgi:hypothetical protein